MSRLTEMYRSMPLGELHKYFLEQQDLIAEHKNYLASDSFEIVMEILRQMGAPQTINYGDSGGDLLQEAALKHAETVGFQRALEVFRLCFRENFLMHDDEEEISEDQKGWGATKLTNENE